MPQSSIPLNQPSLTLPLEECYIRSAWLASTVMLSLWCTSWLANITASEYRRDPRNPSSLRQVQDENTQEPTASKENPLSMDSIREEDEKVSDKTNNNSEVHQKVPSSTTETSTSREPVYKNKSLLQTYYKRFKDSQDILRDLTQMVTTSLLINTLTHEIDSITTIVSWIFVTCAISSILSNNKGLFNDQTWLVHKCVMAGCILSALTIILLPWVEVFY
ncbi:hypothetical protein BDC45DRAFT_556979 [Circinella umbellata]|nr:hypothetical protein BDC45DRAFT_556979 [Circinella umbellata]